MNTRRCGLRFVNGECARVAAHTHTRAHTHIYIYKHAYEARIQRARGLRQALEINEIHKMGGGDILETGLSRGGWAIVSRKAKRERSPAGLVRGSGGARATSDVIRLAPEGCEGGNGES